MNLLLLPVVEAFSLHSQPQPPHYNYQYYHSPPTLPQTTAAAAAAAAAPQDTMCVSRRQSWSAGISLSMAILTTLTPLPSSAASTETTLTETELTFLLHDAFNNIRNELQAPNGGVQTLQQFIQNQDYPAILEYTKTYDQILRKGKMKPAQALLLQQLQLQQLPPTKEQQTQQQQQLKDQMTTLSNAITFDLIGLNRNARPSHTNAAQCDYYLQALREDVQQFLQLEPAATWKKNQHHHNNYRSRIIYIDIYV